MSKLNIDQKRASGSCLPRSMQTSSFPTTRGCTPGERTNVQRYGKACGSSVVCVGDHRPLCPAHVWKTGRTDRSGPVRGRSAPLSRRIPPRQRHPGQREADAWRRLYGMSSRLRGPSRGARRSRATRSSCRRGRTGGGSRGARSAAGGASAMTTSRPGGGGPWA